MNQRRTPAQPGRVLPVPGRGFFRLLLLALLVLGQALAQPPSVEALKARLSGLQGQERIAALVDLVNALESRAPQEALALAAEGLALARNGGDQEKEATFLTMTAFCSSQIGDFTNALQFGKEALLLSVKINNKDRIARARSTLGITYSFLGLYSQALEEHLESLRIREEMSMETASIISLNNIGVLYHQMEQYEKAISYYQRIMQRLAQKPDDSRLIQTRLNIGFAEYKLGRFESALRNHEEALALIEKTGSKTFLAYAYLNLGMTYADLRDFPKARGYLKASLGEYNHQDQKHGRLQALKAMGHLYLLSGQYDRAIAYAKEAAALALRINARNELMASYQLISDLLEKQGKIPESYRYHKLFVATKDAIHTLQESSRIADINMSLITMKQDNEIESLKKERVITSLQLEKGRSRTVILLVSLGSLVAIILILMSSKRKDGRNKRVLEAANTRLEGLNTELHEKIHEIKTLSGLLPICAQCKKIRNDKGYWEQLEGYISQHSAATFTHGICPHCIEELYPGTAERIKQKKQDPPV